MLHDQLGIFTDRSEAHWLFQQLRGRDPNNPWPLLPILSFIAPAGGGKSELMKYLSLKECCLPDGRPALPFVYIDFSHPDAPKDFLSIFVAFRNQLRAQKDELGRSIMFPRFDLGAAIALATSTVEKPSLRSIDEIRRQLTAKGSVLEPLEEMGNALGNLVPVISPLLVGLRWAKQMEPLKALLHHLESGSGWRWYREQRTIIGLPSNTTSLVL